MSGKQPLSRSEVEQLAAAHQVSPAAIEALAAIQKHRNVLQPFALVEGGGALVLGNRAALLNAGVSVAVADREAQRAEAMGRSVIFLAVGGRARALFVLEDPVRPEARAAVQTLIECFSSSATTCIVQCLCKSLRCQRPPQLRLRASGQSSRRISRRRPASTLRSGRRADSISA